MVYARGELWWLRVFHGKYSVICVKSFRYDTICLKEGCWLSYVSIFLVSVTSIYLVYDKVSLQNLHLHFSLQSSLESLTKKNIAMEQDLLTTREDCNGTMNKLQEVELKYLQLQQNIQRCVHMCTVIFLLFFTFWTLYICIEHWLFLCWNAIKL